MYTCVRACAHEYVRACVSVRACVCVRAYVHAYARARARVCVRACVCVCLYARARTHALVCKRKFKHKKIERKRHVKFQVFSVGLKTFCTNRASADELYGVFLKVAPLYSDVNERIHFSAAQIGVN